MESPVQARCLMQCPVQDRRPVSHDDACGVSLQADVDGDRDVCRTR